MLLIRTVISDTSFESGASEDYAIPPDALSQIDSTYMDASMPSLLMRASYVDSPNKKMESLEKVCLNEHQTKLFAQKQIFSTIFYLFNFSLVIW